MNVYLIDYRGTLDSLEHPERVVQALKDQGHVVVLNSATPAHVIDQEHPRLRGVFDYLKEKGTFTAANLVSELREKHLDLEQIIYVDDDPLYQINAEDFDLFRFCGVRWGYFHPKQAECLRMKPTGASS